MPFRLAKHVVPSMSAWLAEEIENAFRFAQCVRNLRSPGELCGLISVSDGDFAS